MTYHFDYAARFQKSNFQGAKEVQTLKYLILDLVYVPLVRNANHRNKTFCSKLLSKIDCKRKSYK